MRDRPSKVEALQASSVRTCQAVEPARVQRHWRACILALLRRRIS